MTSLTYLDAPNNVIFFYRNPAQKIEHAIRDFCTMHRIPLRHVDDAVALAIDHRNRGKSVAAAIEHGKDHVYLWMRVTGWKL